MVDKPGGGNLEPGTTGQVPTGLWFCSPLTVLAQAIGGAQSSRCITDTSEDGSGVSPSREPSQGGPAQPDQAGEQHGGRQHSMCRVLLCPGHPSPGKAVAVGGRQSLAWCPPCPLPTALCPPQAALPHHTQGFCRGQKRCTEPRVMAQVRPQAESHLGRVGLPSSDVPPSGMDAASTVCPAISRPSLPWKIRSGRDQAGPCLQLSVPQCCRITRCDSPPVACRHQDDAEAQPQWAAKACAEGCHSGLPSCGGCCMSTSPLPVWLWEQDGSHPAHGVFLLGFSCKWTSGRSGCR